MGYAKVAATALAFSVALSAVASTEKSFDATHCFFGTSTVVFASEDASIVHYEHKGIYRGNNGNTLLHGASIHCAGTLLVLSKKRTTRGGCKILDPQGDTIALVTEGSGPSGKQTGTADAIAGTGAWRGVSGGGKWQVHTSSRPLVPGSFQGCLRYHGAFTVPTK